MEYFHRPAWAVCLAVLPPSSCTPAHWLNVGDRKKSKISWQLKTSVLSTFFSYYIQRTEATGKNINSILAKTRTTCPGHGHLPLDQVAQSPIQPHPECFQGGNIHNFSRQPVPVSYHLHHKEFLPYIQSKPTVFQFKTITPCPVTRGPGKKSLSTFLLSLL